MAGNSEKTTADHMKSICAIVEERDKAIRQTDIKIEYYKNNLEKVLNKIKNLEKNKKKIAEETKFIHEQNIQLEFIRTSSESSEEVAIQSLINHQYFEEIIARELKTKEKETESVEQECRKLYSNAKENLNRNPLHQELERLEVEFLKVDIRRRDLEVKILVRKRINTQKREIEKRIFYNFYVNLAEEFVIEQRIKEREKLKSEESMAVKRLLVVQEVKLKRKLGASGDKINRLANITFGSQQGSTDILQNKVVIPPPQKRESRLFFNEKLNNMLQLDELKNAPSPKIHIINEKVITPALVTPNFAPAVKRKNKSIDLSRKWQKLMSNRNFTKGTIGRSLSQNRSSQSSQQSQSQPDHLTGETPVASNQDSSIKNSDIRKQVIQSQERQEMLMENIPTPYQIVENMRDGGEQFKPEYPQTNARQYESHKGYKSSSENIDINKVVTQSQETPTYMREKVPLPEYQMVENMNIGTGQSNVENSQIMLVAPARPGNAISRGETIHGGTTPDTPYTTPSAPGSQCEIVPKTTISEQSKSVRFNLEQTASRLPETKSMFRGQGMFDNIFNPFSSQASNRNDILLQQQTTDNTFNLSLTELSGEGSHGGELNFDHGETSYLRSPEYAYELEGDEQQTFKPSEMPSFQGGLFSFGKNAFNPF